MSILLVGFKNFFNFTPFFLLTRVLKHKSIFENNFPIGNINPRRCNSWQNSLLQALWCFERRTSKFSTFWKDWNWCAAWRMCVAGVTILVIRWFSHPLLQVDIGIKKRGKPCFLSRDENIVHFSTEQSASIIVFSAYPYLCASTWSASAFLWFRKHPLPCSEGCPTGLLFGLEFL